MRNTLLNGCILFILGTTGCQKNENETKPEIDRSVLNLNIPERLKFLETSMNAPPDNKPDGKKVSLGRALFYEKMLSVDQSINCASCHQPKFAFSTNEPVSLGINHQESVRSAPALINLAWKSTYFWDGRKGSLEEQAGDPILNPREMGSDWTTVLSRLNASKKYRDLAKAAFGTEQITNQTVRYSLAQFERTLNSFHSKEDEIMAKPQVNIGIITVPKENDAGRQLFYEHCGSCHGGTHFTYGGYANIGLKLDPTERGRALVTNNDWDEDAFAIPTLRNIALTAPYMHDGRFATLREVVDHYAGKLDTSGTNLDYRINKRLKLSAVQKIDLISYLNTLTDRQFTSNSYFAE